MEEQVEKGDYRKKREKENILKLENTEEGKGYIGEGRSRKGRLEKEEI